MVTKKHGNVLKLDMGSNRSNMLLNPRAKPLCVCIINQSIASLSLH